MLCSAVPRGAGHQPCHRPPRCPLPPAGWISIGGLAAHAHFLPQPDLTEHTEPQPERARGSYGWHKQRVGSHPPRLPRPPALQHSPMNAVLLSAPVTPAESLCLEHTTLTPLRSPFTYFSRRIRWLWACGWTPAIYVHDGGRLGAHWWDVHLCRLPQSPP